MTEPLKVGRRYDTTCCIAGGGPAGIMLGYLLSRAGVEVTVLEKHGDFLRDFRGDTIHPSTLEVMHQLGLLDELLERPHQEVREIKGVVGDCEVTVADFTHLPTHCGFVALMPQWDFLNFLSAKAGALPAFRLLMNAAATDLIEEEGRVVGVRASSSDGPTEIRAVLTIGADGRHSVVRERAGLTVEDKGAPIDVLWFRLSRKTTDPDLPLGRFNDGKILIMLYRGDYWQCGYVIAKGGIDDIKAAGLDAFRKSVADIGKVGDRVAELTDWDQIRLLTVKVDRLETWWKPGLLCIGDAAHAMSPVGGVGINLAIQDAVAAANILTKPLKEGRLEDGHLQDVQKRREFPTRVTQRFQIFIQDHIITRTLASTGGSHALPLPLRLLERFPRLRGIAARAIGMGVRPERVEIDRIGVPG